MTSEWQQWGVVGLSILALIALIELSPQVGGLVLVAVVFAALLIGRGRGNV